MLIAPVWHLACIGHRRSTTTTTTGLVVNICGKGIMQNAETLLSTAAESNPNPVTLLKLSLTLTQALIFYNAFSLGCHIHNGTYLTLMLALTQGHREFPFGNSRESRTPKFLAGIPGNFWNSGGNYGEFRKFCPFSIFIVDQDISVLKNRLLSKTLNDVFDPTFCVYRVPVYFQILISKNHWTAPEFRKLRSLHEWGRWDNCNRS